MSIALSTAPNSGSTKGFTALASRLGSAPSTPSNSADREDDSRQLCTIHPDWCTEIGVHDPHMGAKHFVVGNDDRELLDARLLDFSGSDPIIGLGETDTDAAEARAKANEFRKFADDLETLADTIDASTSGEQPSSPPQPPAPTASPSARETRRTTRTRASTFTTARSPLWAPIAPTPVGAGTASWPSTCPRSTMRHPDWTSSPSATAGALHERGLPDTSA